MKIIEVVKKRKVSRNSNKQSALIKPDASHKTPQVAGNRPLLQFIPESIISTYPPLCSQ